MGAHPAGSLGLLRQERGPPRAGPDDALHSSPGRRELHPALPPGLLDEPIARRFSMSVDLSDYYTSRKRRLLKDFDSYVKTTRPVLLKYFGEDVDVMIAQARREYAGIIPQLPYIGGKQPFTQFIIFTGLLL